jgi:hypothetical protein
MSIFNSETLSIWPQRLATNRGNGYLLPGAITNPFSNSQGEVFPNHDCDNTGATGGLGQGQVTPGLAGVPASNPPAQEGGYYPISNQVPPTAPDLATPAFPPPLDSLNDVIPAGTLVGGSQAAFAPCTLQQDFPAIFGGGRVPYVPADP